MAIPYSDVSPYASGRLYLSGGEATYDRMYMNSLGGGSSSGDVRLTGFTALHTETCTQITSYTLSIAAAPTPTLCRMGVYSVDTTTGNLFLIAATANDTTLWSTTFTRWIRPLTTPFNKVANTPYMLGYIIVSAAATPNFMIVANNSTPMFTNSVSQQMPPTAGRVVGQSDLPAGILAANYIAVFPHFMEVLP